MFRQRVVSIHSSWVVAASARVSRRIESCPPRTVLARCEHRDGSFSFLLKPPRQGKRPLVMLKIEGSAR